jgi:hypothetical protein
MTQLLSSDWERVIIVHTQNLSNDNWAPSRALFSSHSSYHYYNWNDIQNTLSYAPLPPSPSILFDQTFRTADAEAGAGPTPNGLKGLDHPKAYVAWSKHPMFDDRNTGWNDPVSQSTDNAYRSQDWWRFVSKS